MWLNSILSNIPMNKRTRRSHVATANFPRSNKVTEGDWMSSNVEMLILLHWI